MEVPLPESLRHHRMQATSDESVVRGVVRWSPVKSLWFTGMALAAVIGGLATISWACVGLFAVTTAAVLLLGHSLGSHRKLIHDSYQCPKWLEYTLVYFGVQVGLAGPVGLLRQHELRDYAQRLPDCHPYLRHGTSFWRDAWWQLHCELVLDQAPTLHIEPRIAQDRFYRVLDRTWMLQQLPVAVLLFVWGGWAFVFWGTCARVTAGVLGHWLIGHFAHNHGGMHYEVSGAAVQGRNIRFTSLLTMGESWHNNHHAFPGSARLGLFAGEWDPGWWVLMVLRRLGLVWSLRLPSAIPARAELQPCDDTARARPVAGLPVLNTREVLRLCWQSDPQAWMEGPAAPVPPLRMQRWLGPHVRFDLQPGTQRLLLHTHAGLVRGLPALCVALATRGLPGRLVAMAMVPAALAFEGLRSSLDMA